MNYKETLNFIAKCLTLSLEEKNRCIIEKQLQSNFVDWDAVVKLSSAHYVFSALYCNLKRIGFLKYVPNDLISYMKYITGLNRERNKQIIAQAQDLNNHLLSNNITPIFLKGTGNLLAGIYEDIAERMVGDIDFIFSKEDYPKVIAILKEYGYSDVFKYNLPSSIHYRRLKKDNYIAAIEIHHEFLKKKFSNEFNYSFVEKDSQNINGISVLSYANKLNLSIIANQISDKGYYYKSIALRNAYDVFLLSKKTSAKNAIMELDKLIVPLNCFLAACYEVFNKIDTLEYYKNKKTAHYLSLFINQFNQTRKIRRKQKRIKTFFLLKYRLKIIFKSIIYKEYQVWVFSKINDKKWWKKQLSQFKIKFKKFNNK